MNSISEYNDQLINNLTKIDIVNYIKHIQSNLYENTDMTMMDFSLKICQRNNEFCVNPIIEFVNLGIKDYEIQSSTLLKTIKRSNLIENEDYKVFISQTEGRCPHTSFTKTYLLTLKAFKKLLLDNDNHKQRLKFQDCYIILEDCISYYNVYQVGYQNKLLSGKDVRIDKMQKTIDELLGYAKDTKSKLDDTNSKLEESIDQNDELLDEIKEVKSTIEELNENIEDIKDAFKETSNRSVPEP